MLSLTCLFCSCICSCSCVLIDAKKAQDKHLRLVHSINHVSTMKNISSKKFKLRRIELTSEWDSIYFNEGSSEAAFLAAGSSIQVLPSILFYIKILTLGIVSIFFSFVISNLGLLASRLLKRWQVGNWNPLFPLLDLRVIMQNGKKGMVFCIFNNVAVVVSYLLKERVSTPTTISKEFF